MLAAADHPTHLNEPTVYHAEWTEDIPTGISWLNLLTSQPIPEEADDAESLPTPTRYLSRSNASSSSAESCYVVLEIQRPRSADEASNKMDDDEVQDNTDNIQQEVKEPVIKVQQAEEKEKEKEEEEEEEEEFQEEIEELHFAQSRTDPHQVKEDQLATSMHIEIPREEYAAEYVHEQCVPVENYAEVTEISIEQAPNDVLFRKAKNMSKFTKRMRSMPSKAMYNANLSTSSDEEPSLKVTKLKTIQKVNEYHSTAIVAVTAEQYVLTSPSSNQQNSDSPRCSTTSLDSIEDKFMEPIRDSLTTKTTFSDLSYQRVGISAQWPVKQQPTETKDSSRKLTRTFAFDRACMEKYIREPEPMVDRNESPSSIAVNDSTMDPVVEIVEEIDSVVAIEEVSCSSSHLPSPFYLNQDSVDSQQTSYYPSTANLPPMKSGSSSVSKGSSIISLMKKYARNMSSEYRLTHNYDETRNTEPTLLEFKYLDGATVFKDDHARESFRKSQTLSRSIASRLNRLGLNKMSSTQDLSDPNKSLNGSCRKRLLTRFRTLLENHIPDEDEPPVPQQSRPWQHKTITELFHERKSRTFHH